MSHSPPGTSRRGAWRTDGHNGRVVDQRRPATVSAQPAEQWLTEVAADAGRACGGLPEDLLHDFLGLLHRAAVDGHRPADQEMDIIGLCGRRAAQAGVPLDSAVAMYLSAAWRFWRGLPDSAPARDARAVRAAAEDVFRLLDRSVASLTEGYALARREMMRGAETLRRELIEDLLRGDGDVGGLVARAEPFGLDMGQPHQVALAAPSGQLAGSDDVVTAVERAAVQWVGDRDVLVAAKDGWIVVIAPADSARKPGLKRLGELLRDELGRSRKGAPWLVSVGRPYPGVYGIARSYEEAREALTMAVRLRLDTPLIHADQLLIYRVLLRDQPAITDLVQTLVGPLSGARGGAGPLLETLRAYFATGCVVTDTARRLHLSVRAITYRLDRIATLTGYDPRDPGQRFTLQAAVLGAQLLGWPSRAGGGAPDDPGTAQRD